MALVSPHAASATRVWKFSWSCQLALFSSPKFSSCPDFLRRFVAGPTASSVSLRPLEVAIFVSRQYWTDSEFGTEPADDALGFFRRPFDIKSDEAFQDFVVG